MLNLLKKQFVRCAATAFFTSLMITACTIQKPSFPTGIFPKDMPNVPDPDAAAALVPAGYKVEVFMKDLIWPTSIEFDESGNVYVAEAGYVYGDPFAPAQIFRITPAGQITRYATGFNGPITDILWYKDRMYVSHRGKISAVESNGNVIDLVTGLPSTGEHQNNQMTVGPDGKIYFGQGTATNSGVVDLSSAWPFMWLMFWPDLHDVPARDMRLTRESFLTPQPNNVLARQGRLTSLWKNLTYAMTSVFNRNKDKSMLVRTRAFQPFGEHKREVKGQVKASGTILRMNSDGTGLEVYAWGLRNPFGVLWGPDGQLYVSENAYDERGSRPIANARDNIWQIKQGAWYGYPDYSSGIPVTDPKFRSPRGPRLKFLMAEHPPVEKPWLIRPEHAGVTKFDFSTSNTFGYRGQMFLTEVGSGAPVNSSDPSDKQAGYVVVRIDPTTKETYPFLSNSAPGPPGMEHVLTTGPRRPVAAEFSPDGNTLYVVDVGVFHATLAAPGPFPLPVPGTGVIWRITKTGANPSGPPANLSPMPAKTFFTK
jgi:glucose/arabinose dehydrogenase